MAVNTEGTHAFTEEERLGRLPKVFKSYAGVLLKEEYKNYNISIVGSPCLRYTYSYTGSAITGIMASVDVWTQEMEDGAAPIVGAFTNTTSVSFDGVNDSIQMGTGAHGYDFNNAFSFSLWVKPDNFGATRMLFSKSSPAVKGYMVRVNTTGKIYFQFRCIAVTRQHEFDQVLNVGEWNHVIFSHSGASNISGTKCYVNGVVNTTAPSGSLSTWVQADTPFNLAIRSNSFNFLGNMDELSVWDKQLTDTEVALIYNNGLPNSLDEIPSYVGSCASYYRMGDNDVYPTVTDTKGGIDGTMVNMALEDFDDDIPT